MKKYASIVFAVIVTTFLFSLGACSDNDEYEVSQEWKDYQANLVERARTEKDETTGENLFPRYYASESKLGSIYVKPSDFITNNEKDQFDSKKPTIFKEEEETDEEDKSVVSGSFAGYTKASQDRPTYENDSVIVRYEGWYYNLEGKKVIFDSTERNTSTGKFLNNAQKRGLVINGMVDGFKTALMKMETGEEIIVCIPHKLAYGTYGKYDNYGNLVISGHTTLFFDVKLLRNVTKEEDLKKL